MPEKQNIIPGRVYGKHRPELARLAGVCEPGLVSIIVPCYNTERFIASSIESALAQTYRNTEIIVIDDGSTDRSLEIIESFGEKIKVIKKKKNKGAPAARNDGLIAARGEFIQFLDADDLLPADSVEIRLNELDSDHDAVFGDEKDINEKGLWIGSVTRHTPPRHSPRYPAAEMAAYVVENNIRTPLPIHRRRLLYTIGGFDEALSRGQETDLHLRLVLKGHRFKHVKCFVSFRRHHQSTTRLGNIDWMQKDPHRYQNLANHWLSLAKNNAEPINCRLLENVLARLLYGKANEAILAGYPRIGNSYLSALEKIQPHFKPEGMAGCIETLFGRPRSMQYVRQKIKILRFLQAVKKQVRPKRPP